MMVFKVRTFVTPYPIHVLKPAADFHQWAQAVAAVIHGWATGVPPKMAPYGPSHDRPVCLNAYCTAGKMNEAPQNLDPYLGC